MLPCLIICSRDPQTLSIVYYKIKQTMLVTMDQKEGQKYPHLVHGVDRLHALSTGTSLCLGIYTGKY